MIAVAFFFTARTESASRANLRKRGVIKTLLDYGSDDEDDVSRRIRPRQTTDCRRSILCPPYRTVPNFAERNATRFSMLVACGLCGCTGVCEREREEREKEREWKLWLQFFCNRLFVIQV